MFGRYDIVTGNDGEETHIVRVPLNKLYMAIVQTPDGRKGIVRETRFELNYLKNNPHLVEGPKQIRDFGNTGKTLEDIREVTDEKLFELF